MGARTVGEPERVRVTSGTVNGVARPVVRAGTRTTPAGQRTAEVRSGESGGHCDQQRTDRPHNGGATTESVVQTRTPTRVVTRFVSTIAQNGRMQIRAATHHP